MAFLEVNLDPFIKFEKFSRIALPNIYNIIGLLEVNNVHGISFSFDMVDDIELFLDTVRSMTESRINVRMEPDKENVDRVVQYKPDVITFVENEGEGKSVFLPSKKVKDVVTEYSQREDIGFVVRLQPDARMLKYAYQYGFDEVELVSDALAEEETRIGYYRQLDQVAHVARIARKNGMRISISGGLNRRIVNSLIDLVEFEFISIDDSLLAEAVFSGLPSVIKDYIFLVEKR